MIVIVRLILIAISLYLYINIFLTDIEDRRNSIAYKTYLFLFVFIINFLIQLFGNLIYKSKLSISYIIETSVNNSLLAVIAFDVYNDLVYNGFYKNYNKHQRTLILILLIIGFMTAIKILELLISSN